MRHDPMRIIRYYTIAFVGSLFTSETCVAGSQEHSSHYLSS